MHLLYCDESNLEHRPGDFLLYGGVVVPSDQAAALSTRIEEIRVNAGVSADANVKFNPPVPPLDHAGFRDLKQAIIEAAIQHDCKFLAYVVLHDLAGDPNTARLYGINTICYHFHCILNRIGGAGMVLVDRFNDDANAVDGHMRQKMWEGVRLPHRPRPSRLTNIIGFHYSAIGQAHFTSLSDILVGSIRFAINAHCRGQTNLRAGAQNLLQIINPLFFREEGQDGVPDLGFHFSPMNVRVPRFHEQYVSLQDFLREAGVASSQNITNNG